MVVALADRLPAAAAEVDAAGLLVLPGGVDAQIHIAEDWGDGQLALAKKARVSQAYLSRLEAGIQKNPSVGVLQRLAKAFGVSLMELLP